MWHAGWMRGVTEAFLGSRGQNLEMSPFRLGDGGGASQSKKNMICVPFFVRGSGGLGIRLEVR